MPKSKGKTAASKRQAHHHPYARDRSESERAAAAASSSPARNPDAPAATTKDNMGDTDSVTPNLIATPDTATKKSKRKNHKSKNASQADRMKGVESSSPQAAAPPNVDGAAPNGHGNPDEDATTTRTISPHTPEDAAAAEQSPTHKHKKKVKELESKLRTSEQGANALRTSVSELEAKMAAMKEELAKVETELGMKTKLLADQDSHVDKVKDAVSCTVCFEALDDPHVLTCGHSACRKCLVQWFRSGNAYRSEEIQEVGEGDDLTYRVKLCHMCREPVFNRPVRLYALQTVIETLGVHVPAAERDADPWKLTFPADPTSYSIADDADSVDRCPACLGEIAGGECQRCEALFTDVDSDSDIDDHSSGLGSDDGSIMDDDDDDDDPVFDAVRNALGMPPRRGATPPERARDVRLTFSPSQPPAVPSFLDDIADEGSAVDSDEDGSSVGDDSPHRFYMSRSPPMEVPLAIDRPRHRRDRTPTLSRRNDVAAPDNEDLELDEAEGYESSFIDDTDSSPDDNSSSDDDDDGDDDKEDGDSEAEVNEAIEDEDDDQPTIAELRARRAARFGAPSAEGAEASTSGAGRRRRRIIESDEESD